MEKLKINSFGNALQTLEEILNEKETELALKLVDDRNMTTHTYIEAIAVKIFKNIPEYCKIMRKIYNKINY